MSNHAFIVGEVSNSETTSDLDPKLDLDPTVDNFKRIVEQLNYDLQIVRDYSSAMKRLNARRAASGDRDLVLFIVRPDVQKIRDFLVRLQAPNRQVIVYAHEKRASGPIAVEYCSSGLACDFLKWGKISRVEERLHALYHGRCPYPMIDVPFDHANGEPRVFIATPYETEYRLTMSNAVVPALRQARLQPCWADEPYRAGEFPQVIRRLIRESALFIANICVGREAINNPNVYYEAGQATALDIPVIFVRPNGESDVVVPADIASWMRIEYDNEVDLAMRLYHGLAR